jgi:hypothetical protein
VTVIDDDGLTASDEDDAAVQTAALPPLVQVEKTADGDDANGDFTDLETISVGSDVTYQIVISIPAGSDDVSIEDWSDVESLNGGAASDRGLTMNDLYENAGLTTPFTFDSVYQAGDTITFYYGVTNALANDDERLDNTFSVSVIDDDGLTASDEDDAAVETDPIAPELAVKKYVDANGDGNFQDITEEANNPTDDVVYKVVISNPGTFETVELTDYEDIVETVESEPALFSDYALNNPVSLKGTFLAPGASITVYFGGFAPDVYGGSLTDTFNVDGKDDDGQTVSASDDATVTTPEALGICPRTPGFWSTHNGEYAKGNNDDLTYDLLPVTLGDGTGKSVVVANDTIANAIFTSSLTEESSKKNGISKLYIHLLAAKFNTENGAVAPPEVLAAMEDADDLLTKYDEYDWDGLEKSDQKKILALKDTLDEFNNRAYTAEGCVEDWWKMEA